MNNAQLINQTSGTVDYYSPQEIVEAARATMGGIDLDPASSAIANQIVQATKYFDECTDGLRPSLTWTGRVWLNHPFSRQENYFWIKKLIHHYQAGDIKQACCITFASTSEAWFAPLFAFPMCFLQPRTNYYLPSGAKARGVTKGSVVTYLGPNIDRFARSFANLGAIVVPYDSPTVRLRDTDFGS
ncbi:MAG: hypothetical protein DCC55_22510 [Chloroflexi bacterium]|nr:MAG: hypothetical protein DCC55_22510 [Chloroflexota bacterium]